MVVSPQSIMRSALFLLLVLSLGARSIVPQGLMIAGSADGGLEIILCDGSNGLGSIPAFRKNVALDPNDHYHMNHESMGHSTGGMASSHHEAGGECEECDFLWASNGFDETVSIDIDIFHNKFEQQRFRSQNLAFIRFSSRRVYQARAPPSFFV